MLNKDYKLGSKWKIFLFFPLAFIAFFIASCTEKEASDEAIETTEEVAKKAAESQVFMVVEEMPTFKGEEASEFRMYIARNLMYPKEAKEQGVTGKIFIKFIVTKDGSIKVPDQETLSQIEGKAMEEVVVVTYRTLKEEDTAPDEKYVNLLREEVIRVVSSSPAWEPGKQRGKAVDVMYTFPVTFKLQ
jgi:protein TonB